MCNNEQVRSISQRGNVSKISISGVKRNNLKDVNVQFPIGMMLAVTGVQGSENQLGDFGPEGGEGGGEIIAQGTPEELSQNPASQTGSFLFRVE